MRIVGFGLKKMFGEKKEGKNSDLNITQNIEIKDISKIYTDKKASISLFLQGETDPIVDPSQYEIMKANLEITKTMTNEEVQAVEAYMLSIK